jgi:capsular exopolysaccharide synthesis family protein
MEDLKIKLEKAEDQLTGYARSTNLIFTSEKENVSEQKLQQLQDELGRAQADRVTKQSRYELASTASPETLSEILEDTSLREYQTRLTELRREAAELRATLTASHPKVLKVLAQLETLESARERERGNILARIRNDYGAAQRREQLLANSYAAQARLVSEQGEKVAHYNILKREVETLRQLYDAMLQRVKEAGVAAALRASNIRIVDPARRPLAPYKPRLTRNAALGVLLGLFLGAGFVFVRERADRTLQDPGDPELYLNVSELGVIPSGESDAARRRLLPSRRIAPEDGESLALVTLNRKPSVIAESFHLVLTSILFSAQNGSRPRVLVLSSPNPREGKTTVTSNLAVALAEVNQRVLLIDADLRRPRVHQIFDLDNTEGLVDVLRRPEPLETLDAGLIRSTSVPNLSVLPSGAAETVSNLLHSPRLAEFVALARRRYDMVLFDTPPMLQMADARVVSRYADAVVLVLRSRHTTRDAAQLARQRLAEDGTPVLGAILNDWNPRRTQSYGYDRYYDHYSKYYGNEKS